MATFEPGTIFAGRYEVGNVLGRGGMGSVYRAQHVGLRKDVALKILGGEHTFIPDAGSPVPAAREGAPAAITDGEARFEREARAIAKLDHPSCVRILDYGRTDHHQYIAMQLLEGTTLAKLLRTERQLSIARALGITRNLLTALAHAHGRGVLHRDIKPENVMLVGASPERAILIDFGLAHLRDDAPLTARGMCIGSPSYLAPERLDGYPHDTRADLYAVGVILYEMLAGARPFVGDTTEEILRNIRERPARPLRAIRDDVSRHLEAVVVRALTKAPARRFESAEEMLGALEDVPMLEHLAAQAAVTAREEQETTMMVALEGSPPSLWSRIWSWLRFGSWRWST
jgi:serine/threonine-protein kinase